LQSPVKPIKSHVSSTTRVCETNASAVTPANIVIARAPMAVIVRAALRAFGFRNAGTPLEMASTPVSAVQPEAKARSASRAIASPVSPTCSARMP
jgi:hypothetical protein